MLEQTSRRTSQGFGDDEAMSLEDAEARRAEISSLNAYGEDLAAVLAFEEQAGGELLDLENSEASLGDMDATVAAAQARLDEAAVALRAVRIRAAEEFSTSVGGELAALAMPHASLSFAVTETTPAAHGADDVRLLFSSHAAAAPADIGKTASGGELSRVMLAIEVVRARTERFPTFVFDEVDAGVGGAAAVENRPTTRPTGIGLTSHCRHTSAAGRGVGRPPPSSSARPTRGPERCRACGSWAGRTAPRSSHGCSRVCPAPPPLAPTRRSCSAMRSRRRHASARS